MIGFGSPSGLRVPRHRSTTAHLSVLYPWHTDRGLGERGVYIGRNESGGGGAWCYDPFQLYTDGVLTSPNIVVLGQVGSGKSTAVKTLLYRSIGQLHSGNGTPRWCAIIDPKGEYGPLADALGLTRLKLYPGGPTRLNPLDAGPRGGNVDELHARRTALVVALASVALRRDLTATEEAALGWVLDAVSARAGRAPTLHDVADVLALPTDEIAARAKETPAALARQLAELRHGIARLIDGHLRGMFDATSTDAVDWSARGVVVDLSAVYHDRDALKAVMIAATGWLQALLADPAPDAPRRMQVLEEIWALLGNEHTAKYVQSCQKLARSYGVANVLVAHRVADFRAQTDDGTATAKIGIGLLAETQTRILFRQPSDQVAEATELLGLTETEQRILPRLARGRAIWHVAERRAVVQHQVSRCELAICDTNARLVV
jgi:type IV secretory pathway VirB4 component